MQSSLALSTTCRLKAVLQSLAVVCLGDRHLSKIELTRNNGLQISTTYDIHSAIISRLYNIHYNICYKKITKVWLTAECTELLMYLYENG